MLSEETIERLKRIKIIEKKFESKVLTFYQNPNSDFGMIGEQTVTDFQNVLNSIDPFRKLMIIADSKGGLMDPGWRVAILVKRRQGTVTVIVPEEARSAATLLAFAAEKIVMLENAQLGVLDPQMDYQGQQVSALDLMNSGDPVIRSRANRIVEQMREYISVLLEDRLERSDIDRICDRFLLLDRTHASHMSSIFQDEVRELKLPVISSMDLDIRALHRLYKSSFFCEHKPSTIIEFYPF